MCLISSPFIYDVGTDIFLHKVWAMGQNEPNRGWQSHTQDMLLNHLKTCMLQPETMWQQAIDWKSRASPVRCTHQEAFGTAAVPLPLPNLTLPGTSQFSNQFSVAGPSTIPLAHPMPTHLHRSFLTPSGSNTPIMSPLIIDSPILLSAIPSHTLSDILFADSQKH
jgi:hypothetical protein